MQNLNGTLKNDAKRIHIGNVFFTLVCYGTDVKRYHATLGPAPRKLWMRKEGFIIMKHKSRKLLALLLALVMVLGMMPVALAEEAGEGKEQEGQGQGGQEEQEPDTSPKTPSIEISKVSPTESTDKNPTSFESSHQTIEFSVTATVKDAGNEKPTYAWTLEENTSGATSKTLSGKSNSITLSGSDLAKGGTKYILTCTVAVKGAKEPVIATWYVLRPNYDIEAYAIVYDSNVGYAFGDVPDSGSKTPIADQILSGLARNEYLDYLTFSDVGSSSSGGLDVSRNTKIYEEDLYDVVFVPSSRYGEGTYYFPFTAYLTKGSSHYEGVVVIDVEKGESSNNGASPIVIAGFVGEELELDSADFEDWWSGLYSSGSLESVEFTSASNGTLYADWNGSKGTNVANRGTDCYVNPNSRQTGIDGLTFVPSKSSTTSATLRFVATGTTKSGSKTTVDRSGTVNIVLMNSQAKNIEYTATNGTVSLNANDFSDAYKSAVGSSSSSLSIVFQNVPANGSLSYKSGSRTTTLTSSNVKNTTISLNNINNVTYTAGRSGTTDTVDYICYSGGTPKFVGSVVFNAKPQTVEGLTARVACNSADGVNIDATTIYSLDTSTRTSAFVTFGTPTAGALYINGATLSSGQRLGFTTNSGYPLFSGVTFRPATGATTETVTIPFSAYDASGNLVASGNLRIEQNIPAAPSTSVPGTTPNLSGTSTATPGKPKSAPPVTNPTVTFSDVNPTSGSWYYNEVLTLANAGLIGGTGNGFEPNRPVTYGEALKMIMGAVGYEGIQQDSGVLWAMPYMIKAATDGILPNISYDITGTINRYAIAELAAKAMHLTPVTNVTKSPYADTSDPYVIALYNAGIMAGTGESIFGGNEVYTRAMMAVTVWRIYDWRNGLSQTPSAPSTTTPTTPDTSGDSSSGSGSSNNEIPSWLLS